MGYMKDASGKRLDSITVLDSPTADARYNRTSVPTYLAANGVTPANRFDHARSIYNWKPTNTRKLRASLNRAATGSLEHHVFIGDSETHCYCGPASPFDPRQMWPRRTRDLLTSLTGAPSGGEGVIRTGKANATSPEPRWTTNSGWSVFTNYAQATTVGAAATFTTAEPCTTIEVYYLDTTGAASVTVDGANTKTWTTVNSGTIKKLTWTGLAATTHTVVVTTTTATATALYGIGAYNASGLVHHNMAAYGTQVTSEWNNASTFFYYAHCVQLAFGGIGPKTTVAAGAINGAAAPLTLHCQIGVNDIRTGLKTPAATVSALQTVLGWFPGAEIYLHSQLQPSDVTAATWEPFVASLYGLADALDVPLFDWHHRTVGSTQSTADGKLSTDGLHPTAAWQYEQSRGIAQMSGS